MVEMNLAAVRVELTQNTPVVLLQEVEGARRTLPIFIGPFEASAIAEALQGVQRPRPMTHDLMRDLLVEAGLVPERVVITELRDSTYYAEIHLTQNGRHFSVSSRPSDAMALAARMGTPIYADESLLDENGVDLQTEDDEDVSENTDELVSQFEEFIQQVRPEDFSS
jgi:bifunctional DNase/RNase